MQGLCDRVVVAGKRAPKLTVGSRERARHADGIKALRILHTCESYWPRSDGVAISVQKLSEGLAAIGHEVTVACASDFNRGDEVHEGVRIRRFDVAGNEARGFTGPTEEYARFIGGFACDVMMNYAAQQATADLVFPLLDELKCRKVFIPCGYSALGDPAFADYFERLPAVLRKYDRVVYLSGDYRDKRFGDSHGITNCEIIPNGASSAEFDAPTTGFRKWCGTDRDLLITCVSNYMGDKGQREVLEAFRDSGVSGAALVFLG
jgi:hypothetical protein